MSKINLGQAVQTLANLSVIVGIVFLALQLQQNSALLASQARATRAQVRLNSLDTALSNPELLQAAFKQLNGEPPTAMEEFILFIDANRSFVSWQFVYGEFREGLIESADVPVENWRNVFRVRDLQRFWQQKEILGLRPDFVQWMDENVVEE
jgi:hypothetical protein